MKRYIIPVYIFLILLFAFPTACTTGAKNGLLLWFNTIIPSIFPFILLTGLLRAFNGIGYFEKIFGPLISLLFRCSKRGAYAVIIGFLCGYPLGAKAVADSYSLGYIDRHEADYLLTFCSNPSPMYLYNYVLTASLGAPELAISLFFAVYLAAWFTGIIHYILYFRKYRPLSQNTSVHIQDFTPNMLMEQCIMDSLTTIQKIGVYMIIFSMIGSLLFILPISSAPAKIILTGICEQTTGIHSILTPIFDTKIKTILATAFASFGGLAVAAQTYGVISSQGLSLKPHFSGKIIHTFLTCLILWIII